MSRRLSIPRDDAEISVLDRGGHGPLLVLLHGLAGSADEFLPTADALVDAYHVVLVDQRGHGRSTRRPADLSRRAFVDDVVAVVEHFSPDEPAVLVGQSMGAHTAFLTAATRPDLVSRLVMLEGHPGGEARQAAIDLGAFFRSWPVPFRDADAARAFLGEGPLTEAWIAGFELTPAGLRPRFDADVMARTIAAVHEPRWTEWGSLRVPTTVVFAEHGMFEPARRRELVERRPGTEIAEIPGAGHDAHLDAHEAWIRTLRRCLRPGPGDGDLDPATGYLG